MEQQEFNNDYYDAVIEHLQEKIEGYKSMRASMDAKGVKIYHQLRLKYINQRIQSLVNEIKTTEDTGYKLWLAEQIYFCNKHKLKVVKALKYRYNQNKIKNDQK